MSDEELKQDLELDDEREQFDEDSDNIRQKKNFFDEVKKSAVIIGKGIKQSFKQLGDELTKGINAIGNEIDKVAELHEIKKYFESVADAYIINGKTLFAYKNETDKCLIFREDDEKYVNGDIKLKLETYTMHIKAGQDKEIFKFIYNEKEYPLPCFKVSYSIEK